MTQGILSSWDGQGGKKHTGSADILDFTSHFKHLSCNNTVGVHLFYATLTEERAVERKVFAISAIVFVKYLHACIFSISLFTF